MENQVSTIVCPNCGANTTNRRNCEYCGSVLVRFVDQNVAVDQNVFGKDALAFSSVVTALKKNLELQNDLPSTDVVLTQILGGRYVETSNIWVFGGNISNETQYISTTHRHFKLAEANIPLSSEPRLILCVCYPRQEEEIRKFRRASYSTLFTNAKIPCYDPAGKLWKKDGIPMTEKGLFYLDIGQDYENAAKIITDFYQRIYENPENTLEVETNILSPEEQAKLRPLRHSSFADYERGCSVALLPMLGIGAGIAAGIVKLISLLLV